MDRRELSFFVASLMATVAEESDQVEGVSFRAFEKNVAVIDIKLYCESEPRTFNVYKDFKKITAFLDQLSNKEFLSASDMYVYTYMVLVGHKHPVHVVASAEEIALIGFEAYVRETFNRDLTENEKRSQDFNKVVEGTIIV